MDKLDRKITKQREVVYALRQDYDGNERNFTAHGGWTVGYHEGKLSALEDLYDELMAGSL